MPGLVPGIHVFLLFQRMEKAWMAGSSPVMTKHALYAFAGSPTISGCRASDTAGDIRITSAWVPKIATAR
jgi:hypothetical protein